jgi:hypothetical protein
MVRIERGTNQGRRQWLLPVYGQCLCPDVRVVSTGATTSSWSTFHCDHSMAEARVLHCGAQPAQLHRRHLSETQPLSAAHWERPLRNQHCEGSTLDSDSCGCSELKAQNNGRGAGRDNEDTTCEHDFSGGTSESKHGRISGDELMHVPCGDGDAQGLGDLMLNALGILKGSLYKLVDHALCIDIDCIKLQISMDVDMSIHTLSSGFRRTFSFDLLIPNCFVSSWEALQGLRFSLGHMSFLGLELQNLSHQAVSGRQP